MWVILRLITFFYVVYILCIFEFCAWILKFLINVFIFPKSGPNNIHCTDYFVLVSISGYELLSLSSIGVSNDWW